MRYLTIKRRKSFTSCAAKMKVYIEDPVYGDTRINGCKCSKIGALKNGEEATFSIGNEETKVFVIGDMLTRNIINDFRTIPAGDEDIYLSGIVDSGVTSGNPFRFDGEGDEEMQANRRRVKKNGVIVLVVTILVALAFGIGGPLVEHYIENSPRDFSAEGMTITLTRAFQENTELDFAAVYVSDNAVVFARKEEFSLLGEGFEELPLEEYGELLLQANPQAGDAQLQQDGGISWFEYNSINPETKTNANYYTCMYKSDDAFWMLQFVAEQENAQRLRPDFQEWAASVRFE